MFALFPISARWWTIKPLAATLFPSAFIPPNSPSPPLISMSDSISYSGCWLSRRRHGDSVCTSPTLITSQYTSLQLICLYPDMLPEERDSKGVLVYRRPPGAGGICSQSEGQESITILQLRAYWNNVGVEAKLEYGLRCVVPISSQYPQQETYRSYNLTAGLDVKQDTKAALKQFLSTVFGPYPDVMRAYAVSLACSCREYDWNMSSWTPETQKLCFHMANESSKLGLFSFPALLCVN